MTRIRTAAPSVAIVALIAGLIGYLLGSGRAFEQPQVHAAATLVTAATPALQTDRGEPLISPTKARARDFFARPTARTWTPMRSGSSPVALECRLHALIRQPRAF